MYNVKVRGELGPMKRHAKTLAIYVIGYEVKLNSGSTTLVTWPMQSGVEWVGTKYC